MAITPAEPKGRPDRFLDGLGKPSPERLRRIRASQALISIGTPEALEIAGRIGE